MGSRNLTLEDLVAMGQPLPSWATNEDRERLGQRKVLTSGAPPAKAKGVQKHTPGLMNQTEERYRDLLELRKLAGEVLWYGFEVITFRLGFDIRYTPDFMVMLADFTLEAHEVKTLTKTGKLLIKDDARDKLKIANELFPFIFRRMAYDMRSGAFVEHTVGSKRAA